MIQPESLPASSPGNRFQPASTFSLSTEDVPLPAGVRAGELPPRWRLEHGATIENGRVAYELSGADGAPVVVVQGGISAHCHVTATPERPEPGWWQDLVGPGRAVDAERFRVLAFDYLGGNGGTSGPRNTRPEAFPAVTTSDQARVLAQLLDRLGIERVEAFVGASYGGMVALAFAALFPERVGKLIVISAAHRSHPQSIAWRSLQRKILRLARRHSAVHEGLALSRALAMVTYRSPAELEQRFGTAARPGESGFRFPVDDYLEARGEDFARTFHPDAFLCLSESIDLHHVDPAKIEAASTLVAVRSDQLVPIEHMWALNRCLRASEWVEISSVYGHDAFLKEIATLGVAVRAGLGAGRST